MHLRFRPQTLPLGTGNVPSPLPISIETVLSPEFATTRSRIPSSLKSPTTRSAGKHRPLAKSRSSERAVAIAKQDRDGTGGAGGCVRYCEIELAVPLKSPAATAYEATPAIGEDFRVKVPSPLPNKIETVLFALPVPRFTTARSVLPSPLKFRRRSNWARCRPAQRASL